VLHPFRQLQERGSILRIVFGLLRAASKPEDATPVVGDVYMIAERTPLEKTISTSPSAQRFHAYLGYCGWGPRQLDNEVKQGAWYIFSGRADLVFDASPDTLWSRLVALADRQIARAAPSPKLLP